MALVDYITVDDITHHHLSKFKTTTRLQAIVDEANDYYEEVSISLGVDPVDLITPISLYPKNLLRAYVLFRFSDDSIGSNGDKALDEDIYIVWAGRAEKDVIELRSRISVEMLKGEARMGREKNMVRFGKAVRTS